eukprot:TRINITY_DN23941_c0_g1_i1.p1 TRINITY_DN23941_c0_g1~~TRINITY_DN23941_c0_g1_i1.p1  ORF type:complete len:335 (+),score=60.67 TRINITY_DN23941_c0_g1_i1:70-1074(+)
MADQGGLVQTGGCCSRRIGRRAIRRLAVVLGVWALRTTGVLTDLLFVTGRVCGRRIPAVARRVMSAEEIKANMTFKGIKERLKEAGIATTGINIDAAAAALAEYQQQKAEIEMIYESAREAAGEADGTAGSVGSTAGFHRDDVGLRRLTFGKHAGKTWQEMYDEFPGYCNWVLRQSQDDSSAELSDFAAYVTERRSDEGEPAVAKVSGHEVIPVGKYRGRDYASIAEEDPDYCEWVISTVTSEDPGPLKEFADFLIAEHPEIAERCGSRQGSSSSPRSGSLPPSEASGRIPFGKYKGQTFEEVLQEDPRYCQWALTGMTNERANEFKEFLRKHL